MNVYMLGSGAAINTMKAPTAAKIINETIGIECFLSIVFNDSDIYPDLPIENRTLVPEPR